MPRYTGCGGPPHEWSPPPAPSERWPESVVLEARAVFRGDDAPWVAPYIEVRCRYPAGWTRLFFYCGLSFDPPEFVGKTLKEAVALALKRAAPDGDIEVHGDLLLEAPGSKPGCEQHIVCERKAGLRAA